MIAETTVTPSRPVSFKIDGLDCPNEVRALRAVLAPIVGGDHRLSFDTKAGTMEVTLENPSAIDLIGPAVASTGMRAHLLAEPVQQSAALPLLFHVVGLDCKNEVAALKREIGPLVGGEAWLMFDAGKGLMTVAPQQRASVDDIISGVAATGMRAFLVTEGMAETLLFRVHGLDSSNRAAVLARELGPLVGADKLVFDPAQGMMTVAPQSRAAPGVIKEAVARTGMRAEPWSPPASSSAVPEPTGAQEGAV